MGVARFPRTVWRIALGLCMVTSLIFLPVWITGILALVDALVFNAWPEVIALGVVMDAAFGSTFSSIGSVRHILWSVGIVTVTQVVRHQTRVIYGFS